jgi:hypothetical protein
MPLGVNMPTNEQGKRKAYKGIAMEGIVAKQYDRIQKHMIEEYKSWALIISPFCITHSH